MEASPAPKPLIRKRRWPWILGGIGVAGLLGGLAVVASYPKWAGPYVEAQLEQRLSARLGTTVEIESLDLAYEQVALHGVSLAEPDVRIDHVELDLAGNPLWKLRAEVTEARVRGGYFDGSREEFETLARVVLEGLGNDEGGEGSWLRSRVRLRPDHVVVEGLLFEVTDAGAVSRLGGELHLDADPETLRAEVELTQFSADLRDLGDKRFKARRVATKLAWVDGAPTLPLVFDVSGGATSLTDTISLAGVKGTIEVSDLAASRFKVDLEGGFGDEDTSDASLWSLSGSGKRDLSQGKVVLAMEAFELGRIPQVVEKIPGLVSPERATVAGDLAADLADGKIALDGHLELEGLNLQHHLLAADRVEDVDLEVELVASVEPAAYRVDLEKLALVRRGARLEISGEVVHAPERPQRRYQIEAKLPKTPCQTVLNAIPEALVPSLRGLKLEGNYEARVALNVDFSDIEALSLETDIRPTNCGVLSVPAALSPARLRNGFTHRVTMRDGRQRAVRLFAGSGSYVSLSQISPHMVAAVLTTEDGGFWRHRGFLPLQFAEALRRNLKAGRVRLGASTITMQMVKNVFLSHERTLSRKLQELVLTEYVERVLDKNRIMELYLNVIEFGPGIYGVVAAAEHYFGKHPQELNSLETAYLALMLPSPVRRHAYYCEGKLPAQFERKLRMIHGLMFSRGHIPETEYLMWKDAPLEFDPLRVVDRGACLAEIDGLLAASEGQRAVTGLLRGGSPEDDAMDEEGFDEIDEEIEYEAAPEPQSEPEAPGRRLPDLADDLPSLGVVDEPADGALEDVDPAESDAPGVPAMER